MMNKIMTQPAGYAITVASWENDGDYNATKTMSVATLEQARIVTSIAKLFRSYWRQGSIRGETSFDNMYDASLQELHDMFRAISKIIGDYPLFQELFGWDDFVLPTEQDFSEYDEEAEDNPVEYMHDAVFELLSSLGLSGQQDNQDTRVAENITVRYYPEAVYAEDVTDAFI